MWNARSEPCEGGRRFELQKDGAPLSFIDYLSALAEDSTFSRWYTELLVGSEYDAFFWEHPALSEARMSDPAEFVLIDAPSLAAVELDPQPFREPLFREPDRRVICFSNLAGDARLAVPRGIPPSRGYAHLAAFLSGAQSSQIAELWQTTAREVRDNIGARPKWLSTAGMGVAWVHIRLDARPKYYRFAAYARKTRE